MVFVEGSEMHDLVEPFQNLPTTGPPGWGASEYVEYGSKRRNRQDARQDASCFEVDFRDSSDSEPLGKFVLTWPLQLGTFGRAKRKVDELQRVIAESRRAGH